MCGILRSLPDDLRDSLIYNARDAEARSLADWWEDRLAIERRQKTDEAQARRNEALKASILNKLTPEEAQIVSFRTFPRIVIPGRADNWKQCAAEWMVEHNRRSESVTDADAAILVEEGHLTTEQARKFGYRLSKDRPFQA